jgi:hypothetical protein
VALRLLFKDLAARREYEEDRRRDQPRRVGAWTTRPYPVGSAGDFVYELVVQNGSEEVMHRVRATMVDPDSPFPADPVAAGNQVTAMAFFKSMPPDDTYREKHHVAELWPGPVSLSFVDGAGRSWKHYPDGRLVEQGRQRRSRKDYMNAWIAGELDYLDN